MLRGVVWAALASGGVARKLLAAAVQGRWQPVVSPHLLAELAEALADPKVPRRLPPGAASALVADLRAVARVVPDAPKPWRGVTADPDDDYLVAPAQSVGVDALISWDHHLTDLVDLVPSVVRPPDFLAMVEGGR